MTNAGRKLTSSESATESPRQTAASKMTLRQFAVACLEWHIDDWEKANERTVKGSRWTKESPFFFMRQLKGHPKLLDATATQAAEVFASLFENEPTVQDYFLSENMGLDDVVTYVHSRWDKIRILPGMSPLDLAIEQAKGSEKIHVPAVFGSGGSYVLNFEQTKKHYLEFLQTKKKPTWDNLRAYFSAWGGAKEVDLSVRAVDVRLVELGVLTPSEGIFIAAVWRLHWGLAKTQGEGPIEARPPMILSCDSLGEALGVSSKTAWTYRTRLEKAAVIVKLPRQGPADRFELDPLLFGTWVAANAKTIQGNVKPKPKIDLD